MGTQIKESLVYTNAFILQLTAAEEKLRTAIDIKIMRQHDLGIERKPLEKFIPLKRI